MATIINYNITNFNELEWNGLPYGDDSIKVIAIINYDNGYKVTVNRSPFPGNSGQELYDVCVIDLNSNDSDYKRLSITDVTNKLLEIQNL